MEKSVEIVTLKNTNFDPHFAQYIKVSSSDHRLKSTTYKYKTSRRKHRKDICDLRLGKDFLDMTPKI